MTQIKLRRDTSANFTSKNPVLGLGEPAYETDTKKLKIGDGTTAYTQLEYFSAGGGGSTDITATLPLKIVDGVISLEVDGQTIQIVDGKLHANLDELSNTVNTLSDDVGTAFDLINIAQTDIQSNTENITNLQNALSDKQDKFETQVPLSISNNSITTSVDPSITETAESWTGGGVNKSVNVDVSALNIDANSNWKIHLSGYMGDYSDNYGDTRTFSIYTENNTIFSFWFGSRQFRLGINTATFNRIPAPDREFFYEIGYQKNGSAFIFDGTNLTVSDPLPISTMSAEIGQGTYTTLAGKGKLKNFSFVINSHQFRRIDKDISKSYFEADGVRYPITSVEGINTLSLAIGSGLSVVDGKLTATGGSTGGITIDDVSPDYTAGIDVSGYTTSSNQFTAPSAGIIYFFAGMGGGTGARPKIYINDVLFSDLYAVGSTSTFSVNNGEQFVLGKGDKYYATFVVTGYATGANMFYPLKGVNK